MPFLGPQVGDTVISNTLTLDGGASTLVEAWQAVGGGEAYLDSGSSGEGVVRDARFWASGRVIYRVDIHSAISVFSGSTLTIKWRESAESDSAYRTHTYTNADWDGIGYNTKTRSFTGLDLAFSGSFLRLHMAVAIARSGGSGAGNDYLASTVYYNRAPTAPTSLSPANGSTVSGLVPTFQGTHNDPDAGGNVTNDGAMNAVDIEVRRVSDDALFWASGWASATGSTFSKGYAGTTLVSGTQYKWRGRTRDNSGASNNEGAWSSYLTFTPRVNVAPVASFVSPAAGASVGTLTPTLTFGFSDANADDVFTRYQVQVRRASDSVSFWDTGQVETTAGQKTAKQASVGYAGTTLVNGTAYQWRVRVQDAYDTWSAYTSYRNFTPNLVPNPPTITSPGGLTNTLTPDIEGVYSQGSGDVEAAFQYEIRQSLTTIYQSGDVATAIATGQEYGTSNAGSTPSTAPMLAWGTAYSIRMRSKDDLGAYSDWTEWVAFNTNAAPTAASNVTPTNGAITPDTTPTITWTHNDPDGDAQTAADVELYDVTDDAYVTGYDPKTLSQSTTTHDVTETLDLTHQYRVRVRTVGLAGPGAGPYSTPQTFTVADVPAIAMAEPDPDDVVSSSALTVEWTFSGGSGTQQDYRVRIYDDDGTTVLHDSGVTAGTGLSYSVPAGVIRNGGAYFARVNVRDTLSQEGVTDLVAFTASFTPPATITGLVVTSVGDQA